MLLLPRVHYYVGAFPGAGPVYWEGMLRRFAEVALEEATAAAAAAAAPMRAMILEENAWPNQGDLDHGLLRALGHAHYSIVVHRHTDVVNVHGEATGIRVTRYAIWILSSPVSILSYYGYLPYRYCVFHITD